MCVEWGEVYGIEGRRGINVYGIGQQRCKCVCGMGEVYERRRGINVYAIGQQRCKFVCGMGRGVWNRRKERYKSVYCKCVCVEW